MKEFPVQTLELCRSLLKRKGNEGVYRTVIARSYYATLLFAALWIDENHKKVDWNKKCLYQFVPSQIDQYLPNEHKKTIRLNPTCSDKTEEVAPKLVKALKFKSHLFR